MNDSNSFGSDGVNSYAPYKKARSFMTPTIFADSEEVLAYGSPGGNKIPQILGQVAVDYFAHGHLERAIEAPRIVNDDKTVLVEKFDSQNTHNALEDRGLRVRYHEPAYNFGSVNAVRIKTDGTAESQADSRRSATQN